MFKKLKHPRPVAILLSIALIAALALLAVTQVKLTITGRWEGLFLLKCRHGKPYELKDNIYLGDGRRLIATVPFWWLKTYRSYEKLEKNAPSLYYEWDEKEGRGFVRNFLPGGGRISTCFSLLNSQLQPGDDMDAIEMHGLLLGGCLPALVSSDDLVELNESGMAYWNGDRWYHIWCSANEGMFAADSMKLIPPADWRFLGSEVLKATPSSLAITSSHEITVQGQPLRMDRFAYFRAGKTYFLLSVWIKNVGDKPVSYDYVYGDEPWLGDFGSSEGNVGWVKDGLITNAQFIDSKKYSYAGYFDYGNKTSHDYTWVANFIEWFGDNTPSVYFSNDPYEVPKPGEIGEPLYSNERYIGLQWDTKTLAPGERTVYIMAIGVAGNDPDTGFPVKPEIKLGKIPH